MKNCLLILTLLISGTALSQGRICGFSHDLSRMNIDIAKKPDQNIIDSLINANIKKFDIDYRNEITIPVVFHVFNITGAANKVRAADIYRQLDKLNEAFAAANFDLKNVPGEFRHLIGNSNIKFCIGYRKNNGENEKGIILRETDIPDFADKFLDFDIRRRRIKYSEHGGSDQWDSNKYINVWVGELSFIQGTSTFPDIPSELKNDEGIVIDLDELKVEKRGKILVHEMGHYFSLLHIWGNLDNDCDEDDGIEDTPSQLGPYYGCPSGLQFSCGSSDMYMNYMDYTDQYCSLMFTTGQIQRMRESILAFRPSLVLADMYCYKETIADNHLREIELYTSGDHVVILTEKPFNDPIELTVFDISGKKLLQSVINPGQSSYHINKNRFYSGIYIFRLKSENLYDNRKLAIFAP
jgi:hypothetical protein